METKISDFITEDQILLDYTAKDAEELIESVTKGLLAGATEGKEGQEKLFEALKQRESLGSTAIGSGIALPHARMDFIKSIFLGLVRLEEAIEFKAIDRAPCDLFFFLLAPSGDVGKYLKTLSKISKLLKDPEFPRELREASDSKMALAAIQSRD
ncbi:PTS sugar transporter subunit IIA [Candidatus Riflebacteria bacterium]